MRSAPAQSLRQIAAIRVVQRRAKEMEAQKANGLVAGLNQDRVEVSQAQAQNHAQWKAAVSNGALNLPSALAWASAVQENQQRLVALAVQIAKAETEAGRIREEWRLASVRADVAEETSRKAARREASDLEERRLTEASDQVARRC